MNHSQPARTSLAFIALIVGALTVGACQSSPVTRALDATFGEDPREISVFDDDTPSVANLDPDLLDALRRAATDAAAVGVEFVVTSGWRTPEYQARLLRDAVATYGSEAEAARWVATPNTSAHVSGDAVDLGPAGATA